jgi:hypothetical protein
MAGRVKGDCGANSMEHSFALTYLIPIGLWVMVIGWHLGSACSPSSGGGKGIWAGWFFCDVEAGRMAPAEFLDTRSARPEIVGGMWSGHVFSSGGSGVCRETAGTKTLPAENPRQSYFSIPLPRTKRAGRKDLRPARHDAPYSFIDRGVRQ